MRKAHSKTLTAKQRAELKALAQLADKDIDIESIPEVRDWSGAKRGVCEAAADLAARCGRGRLVQEAGAGGPGLSVGYQ
jgi:hypothetical protein